MPRVLRFVLCLFLLAGFAPSSYAADDVAAVLGISRANAYTLMHSKDFPTITIGKRMIVPKDKLLAWMDERMSA